MAVDERELVVEQAERLRDRLVKRLGAQRSFCTAMLAWYSGEQDPPPMPRDATGPLYRRMRESSRNTWASLLVDSIGERLEVQGYRSATGDRELEARAWGILQANRIDADQAALYADALICSRSYVSVMPADVDPDSDDVDGPPLVAPESPLEVAHLYAPGSRRRLRAVLKCFELDAGWWRAELYSPELVFVWLGESGDEASRDPFTGGDGASIWDAEPLIADNEAGRVPFVPFENRPTTTLGPRSEIEQVEHVLQRIDDLVCARQVTSHFQAFRQRWATGLEIPTDPETGEKIEPFKSAVTRLWVSEDDTTKFGSFDASDLGQYTRAIEAEVAELAAISRVPAHYFVQSELANPPSADSLTASESGLVQKVRSRQRVYGESWEQVVRLALALDAPAPAVNLADEIVWRDPAVRHPAQVADAATKFSSIGVPREALWAYIGATPQQVETWRTLAAGDELRALELALTAERIGTGGAATG